MAIILLAGLLIYSPMFRGGWLWDDDEELTQNPAVQAVDGLKTIWQGQGGADFLPIKSTVQWIVWHIFGNDPVPFHVLNITLHLISALLLWRLFSRLGMRHGWVGGLIFVVHPIFVESVAWASELKNTLSLAALLPAMLAWVTFDERHRWQEYGLALLWFIVGLLCKSSVIMWPVVILLHAWWRRGKVGRADVVASLPFFAVSLAAAITTIVLQRDRSIFDEVYPVGGVLSHIALSGLDVTFYAWKLLVPVRLVPMYPQWRVSPPHLVQFLPWPALAGLFCWLWKKRHARWSKAMLLGLGFFAVNLVPVSGIFRMSFMRISWVSDHFVYLPAIGIVGLAATGLGAWYDRAAGWRRLGVVVIGWLSLGGSILASYQDAFRYASLESIARYTIGLNPDAWLGHQSLSVVLIGRNDVSGAFEEAKKAVALKPDAAETQNALGHAMLMGNDVTGAIEHFREAVRLAPEYQVYRVNLARSLAGAERYDEAVQFYEQALRSGPPNAALLCDLGVCLGQLGRWDDAVARFRAALAIDPNLPHAGSNLAVALRRRSGDTGSFLPGTAP